MSSPTILVDTGPLAAFLREAEAAHAWAAAEFKELPAPFLTCEPVLAETFFLVSRHPEGPRHFFDPAVSCSPADAGMGCSPLPIGLTHGPVSNLKGGPIASLNGELPVKLIAVWQNARDLKVGARSRPSSEKGDHSLAKSVHDLNFAPDPWFYLQQIP